MSSNRIAHLVVISLLLLVGVATGGGAQTDGSAAPPRRIKPCAACAVWNTPQKPFRIYGNSYWVGTHGLGAILITSSKGHVLIDGALPESAPLIEASIRALGFRVEDVKTILNSHDHFDHAGGIAELQRASGARVLATESSAQVLRQGVSGPDDPQYGLADPYPRVANVGTIADGATVSVGDVRLTAHITAGHTPGGTTWAWTSCENGACLNLVYADSQTPVSADGFYFTHNKTYPTAVKDFERGAGVLDNLPCDILLTPHPDASGLWERLAARDGGEPRALVDTEACRRYASSARAALAARLATERAKP